MYAFFISLPDATTMASSTLPITGSLISDFLPWILFVSSVVIALIVIGTLVAMLRPHHK